jgi:phosphoglycolate phosphatase-like HAD superfamily hydrolase
MPQAATLSRPWDSFDAYLFDIDGTLINCTDAVHYFAFCDALETLSGRPLNLDGVTAHGNTDVGILRDALTLAEVPESHWRPLLAETRQGMGRFVDARKAELCTNVLPSAAKVLRHLRARGAVLGVATGNLEAIGKLKLANCGLLELFDFGGWSDEFEYRADVFRSALAKARELAGANASVCVLGDTPEDIRAAHSNGLEVIAVSTGIYDRDQLAAGGPELLIGSLSELLPVPAEAAAG